jgi:hypothetical protein
MADKLTMNHAFERLEAINSRLRDVLERWDNLSDKERFAYVRQVQEDLANALTPAINWRTVAYLNGVAILPMRLLLKAHRWVTRLWKRR